MAKDSETTDKSQHLLKRLGRSVYLFIIALAVIVYFSDKVFVPLTATHLSSLLLNLSAGLILAAVIFFLVNQLGFDLDSERQSNLDAITERLRKAVEKIQLLEPLPQVVEGLSAATERLSETADKLRVLEDCDLYRYYDQIASIGNDEWYECIRKANGPISLMAPSLSSWFRDRTKMKGLLVKKALENTKIRLIIMGQENDVATGIA